MQDVFYEESVSTRNLSSAKTKYVLFTVVSIISYFFAVALFFLFMIGIDLKNTHILFIIILIVIFIGSIVLGVFYSKKRHEFFLDYDYTFISGSVRISKVMNGRKRKLVVMFDTDKIFQLGKFGSETYEKLIKTPDIKKIIATPNEEPDTDKNFYYIAINDSDVKKIIVIECKELFMFNVLKFSNKTVLEKDFK